MIGQTPSTPVTDEALVPTREPELQPAAKPETAAEIGGRDGPEPTRYGDWEKNGRCIDF